MCTVLSAVLKFKTRVGGERTQFTIDLQNQICTYKIMAVVTVFNLTTYFFDRHKPETEWTDMLRKNKNVDDRFIKLFSEKCFVGSVGFLSTKSKILLPKSNFGTEIYNYFERVT